MHHAGLLAFGRSCSVRKQRKQGTAVEQISGQITGQITGQIGQGRTAWSQATNQSILPAGSLRPLSFSKGTRVKVCRGMFAGAEGIIESDSTRRLLVLTIQVLHKPVLLEVDPACVELLT